MATAIEAGGGRRVEDGQELDDLYTSSQWKLIVIRFRKHKPAVVSLFVLVVFYLLALLAPFFAVHDPNEKNADYREAPPQGIHFVDHAGRFSPIPVIYPFRKAMNPDTFEVEFSNITEEETRLVLLRRDSSTGSSGSRWTVISSDRNVPAYPFTCWVATGSAAISTAASCTAVGSRSPSDCSAWPSASFSGS